MELFGRKALFGYFQPGYEALLFDSVLNVNILRSVTVKQKAEKLPKLEILE